MARIKVFKPSATDGYTSFLDYFKSTHGNHKRKNPYTRDDVMSGLGDENWTEAEEEVAKRYGYLTDMPDDKALDDLVNQLNAYNDTLPTAPVAPPSSGGSGSGTSSPSSSSLPTYNSAWKDKIDALLDSIKNRPDFEYGEKPVGPYGSDWQQKIDQILHDMDSRPKFNFDASKDPVWQALADQAVVGGQRAMADTLAKASAMTGGQLNSHSQAVGQQAYQGYLQSLSAHMPGVVQAAQSRYDQEGRDMRDRLGIAMGMEGKDWDRYRQQVQDYDKGKRDAWEKYLYETGQMQDQLDTLIGFDNRDYQKWHDKAQMELEDKRHREEMARLEAQRQEEKRRYEEAQRLELERIEEEKRRYEEQQRIEQERREEEQRRYEEALKKEQDRWETEKNWHDQARQDALSRPSYSGGGNRGGGSGYHGSGNSHYEGHEDTVDYDQVYADTNTGLGDAGGYRDHPLNWYVANNLPIPGDEYDQSYEYDPSSGEYHSNNVHDNWDRYDYDQQDAYNNSPGYQQMAGNLGSSGSSGADYLSPETVYRQLLSAGASEWELTSFLTSEVNEGRLSPQEANRIANSYI